MSRSQRLLALLQLLRGHRYPVAGARLAEDLGISLRTLYRDIATLQEQGATIEGEPGLGYVLRPGFMLPPLMFSEEEIEALVLGTRWVAKRADARLAEGAASALAKVAAVLPADLRLALDTTALLVPGSSEPASAVDLSLVRQAIRSERKVALHYRDLQGAESTRTVWPFALGYFDHVRVLTAWCELRQDFRHFRADRIIAMDMLSERYPARRQALLKTWREQNGIAADKN
ncbi:MAG: YafY family transcriptional regulator [Paludibacterium sp.]|uniref:helix-turn-helix transcriptional regulator n=1 Tax=Paludibacterium sp. TaxID=1917523 RepID=UPI0025EE500C|nr:YafY family protein [Paludibacterium sp.]MBV8047750.1 YafY family transcriptional regulator [Paludibacterium sp.]MBV8648082.1 YafY family transcriptional regulator [Paludibacterium sp.]